MVRFFGSVFLNIGELQLGLDVPVIGFARSLNRGAYEFQRGAVESFYTDMDLYNPPFTFFRRKVKYLSSGMTIAAPPFR